VTKTLMNDKDVSVLNFSMMGDTTKKAFEFMSKLLKDESKVMVFYSLTCKIEFTVREIIRKL
jgi:hypothetical protein